MSIQPRHSLLVALRAALRKAEADPETAILAELKRILRENIALIESTN